MARAAVKMLSMVAALLAGGAWAARTEATMSSSANPIRRVVTMLQMMSNKVEEEGKKVDELFEKFMTYCDGGADALKKSVADAGEKIPQLESDIEEAVSTKKQLDEDLVKHKADREDAKAEIAKATSIRQKEADAFAKESGEAKSNLDAMGKAITAIAKGMEGGFLQTNAASVLKRLSVNLDMSDADRDLLASFLTGSHAQGYAPASGEILGILKQMKDTMEKELADMTSDEEGAKRDFEGLVAAKEKEIAAATKAIEEKTARTGEVAVEIVNMKADLEDTQETLAEDKKFLADLDKNCALKKKEWEVIKKTRQEELIALADTIKILNDDDALDLFKKAVPSASASLLQVEVTAKEVRSQALSALKSARSTGSSRDVSMDFIALALHSKKVSMDKVVQMIDEMVVLLGKEQVDDDEKKAYCEAEFDKADDKKKGIEQSIADLEKAIAEAKETSEGLASEIESLTQGIVDLDRRVAAATEQRKEEHEEFVANVANNNAAVQLIEIAKNRMNKFYNPKLYKEAPKRELSEEERITLNMGGTLAPTNPPGGIAGTGVSFLQTTARSKDIAAPAPPPETPSEHKKSDSSGALAMMDMLKADIEKEIQEMEFEEKDSQDEYQQMVLDGAKERAASKKSIEEKMEAKAELEAELVKTNEEKMVESEELMATKKYIADLHGECDWLLQNFDTRKEARTNEVDALKKAKAVLSGADYSLVQTGRRTITLHRRM